jgi:ATP-dependent RNA helicase DDX51/DBP6
MTILIFTKSNESALRLSRLLTLLDSSLSDHLSTLTSTTPTHIRRKTLRAFSSPTSPIRLIIASDLVARGIDIPQLDHVINYDLPPSVAGYVHRVGRTARAGRSGRAWTLVGDEESGWFWGRIAKGSSIRRAQKVGRVRIDEMDETKVSGYEAVLVKLGQEAQGTRSK